MPGSPWRPCISASERGRQDPGLPNRLVSSCCGRPVDTRRNANFLADAPDIAFVHRRKSLACPADNGNHIHLGQPLKIPAFDMARENGREANLESRWPSPHRGSRVGIDALVRSTTGTRSQWAPPRRPGMP